MRQSSKGIRKTNAFDGQTKLVDSRGLQVGDCCIENNLAGVVVGICQTDGDHTGPDSVDELLEGLLGHIVMEENTLVFLWHFTVRVKGRLARRKLLHSRAMIFR